MRGIGDELSVVYNKSTADSDITNVYRLYTITYLWGELQLACSHQALMQECKLECHGRLVSAYDHQIPYSNPREPFDVQLCDTGVVRR